MDAAEVVTGAADVIGEAARAVAEAVDAGVSPDAASHLPLVVLVIGAVIVLATLSKVALERLGLPALIGYVGLGALLRLADAQYDFLQVQGRELFLVLERIGIICLLFRVGLESKLGGLMRELGHATLVWLASVFISGVFAYGAAAWLLGLPHVPSLFVGVALTATSVGMAVGEWSSRGMLNTPEGELLVDVVEMDDLSAVVLMGVLLSCAAQIHAEDESHLLVPMLLRLGWAQFIKLFAFGGVCLLFARYAERPVTHFVGRRNRTANLLLLVVGSGFVLAALAGLIGLSVAIGAFFAGLTFSRDPEAMDIDHAFDGLYNLFVPFLFIGIGLKLEAPAYAQAVRYAPVLFAAAVAGKLAGVWLPARVFSRTRTGLLLGMSMVPRAEIALLILQQGYELGPWAVPSDVLSAVVIVCLATWFLTPVLIRPLFAWWAPAVQAANPAPALTR